ncbi:MerR family transcriptional regulator, partial [Streptomyces alboviridis]|uniref:MerR family transcriptional regulator n=1 Tax=Streptomyces alboviridis TaxID=67269 RepID=UPI000516BD59
MRIGELSRRTGVHERLLRYYEEQNLLRPQRRPSGYREYSEADVDTVRRIRSLLAAGLNTATIATILPCLRDDGERLVPTCSDLLADLTR